METENNKKQILTEHRKYCISSHKQSNSQGIAIQKSGNKILSKKWLKIRDRLFKTNDIVS